MLHANNVKHRTTHDGKNGTTKARKNQNARRNWLLQVLWNIGCGHNQTSENERKHLKKYLRRVRKLLQTKLCSRKFSKGINAWAVHFVRYSGPFFKWTREEFKQMDKRTRKCMTLYKSLYPRDDVYRLYISRKEGVRGLAIIDAPIQNLEEYILKRGDRLFTATTNSTDNTSINSTKISRK